MTAGCAPGVRRMLSSSRFQSTTTAPEKRVCSAARAARPGVALDEAPATAGMVAIAEMAPTRAAMALFMLSPCNGGVDAVRRDMRAVMRIKKPRPQHPCGDCGSLTHRARVTTAVPGRGVRYATGPT